MPQVEEGVTLSDYVCEIIEFLQWVHERLEADEEVLIHGDPFYQRPDGKLPLSDEDIDRVVAAIDAEFAIEIGSYPGYHRNRSGAEATPDFHRLSSNARRAVVETLDQIVNVHHHRAWVAPASAATPTSLPDASC